MRTFENTWLLFLPLEVGFGVSCMLGGAGAEFAEPHLFLWPLFCF